MLQDPTRSMVLISNPPSDCEKESVEPCGMQKIPAECLPGCYLQLIPASRDLLHTTGLLGVFAADFCSAVLMSWYLCRIYPSESGWVTDAIPRD